MGNGKAKCSACGEVLGDPTEEMYDEPAGLTPENPHLKVVRGEKGARLQCMNEGQMTTVKSGGNKIPSAKIIPDLNSDQKSGSESKQSHNPSGSRDNDKGGSEKEESRNKVYDIKEDKTAEDIVREVIGNPTYGLNDDQIKEVMDWAEIYDGDLKPEMLQEVVSNLSGVAKQTAKLMAQKYRAKRSKWLQERYSDDSGPPIGGMQNPSGGPSKRDRSREPPSNNMKRNTQPEPEPNPQPDRNRSGGQNRGGQNDSTGRNRRKKRRADAADKMAEEFFAQAGAEAAQGLSDLRRLVVTAVESKVERDPDWLLDNMWIFDWLNEEGGSDSGPPDEEKEFEADKQVDEALDRATGGGKGRGQRDRSGGREHGREDRNTENNGDMNEILDELEEENRQDGEEDDRSLEDIAKDGDEEELLEELGGT